MSDPHSDAGREQQPAETGQNREAPLVKGGAWVGGVILIALGVIFLLQNFGFPVPDNWWAIFIMIPAVAALAGAWSIYQREHAWTSAAMGALVSGLILAGMSIIFLFGYDFGKFWPIILILLGIAALSGRGLGRRSRR